MSFFEKLFALRSYPADKKVQTLYVDDLSAQVLEKFLESNCDDQDVKLIVVYESSTLSTKKSEFYKSLCDLDIFERRHLELLLKGHRLIPRHQKLSAPDTEYILSHYEKCNMPILSIHDPMSILYDFKQGDVIKITRQRGIFYRLVCD